VNQLVPFNRNSSSMIAKKAVDYLQPQEAESIKHACTIVFERSAHTENDEWIRDRDILLLTMMWVTGARISDVLAMSSEKIDFRQTKIKFLVKKRKDKERADKQFWHEITLDIETITELADYLQRWQIKGLLFPAHRHSNKQLSRQAVALKVKSLAKIVGINRNIHCHLWRHGIAMFLQKQGVYAEMISYRLAHSSTAVTLGTYARLDADQERNMLEAIGASASIPNYLHIFIS
jgi:integrase/recombinase XerD